MIISTHPGKTHSLIKRIGLTRKRNQGIRPQLGWTVCLESHHLSALASMGSSPVAPTLAVAGSLCSPPVAQNALLQPVLSASSNLTILAPSQQAVEDMNPDEKNFWLSESNIPALIK